MPYIVLLVINALLVSVLLGGNNMHVKNLSTNKCDTENFQEACREGGLYPIYRAITELTYVT